MPHECKQEKKINELCKFQGSVESDIKNISKDIHDIKNNHLAHIYKELKKLAGRPSWIVTFILISLVSIVSVLLTI